MSKISIPIPAKGIFKYPSNSREQTILNEVETSMKIIKIDGTDLYMEGAQYPKKGFPSPESIWSANQAKILFVEMLKFPFFLLFVNKEKLLASYNRIAMKAVRPFLLKRIYMTKTANELRDLVFTFLTRIGISQQTSQDFADIFAYIIDTDDAYRYRIQDILSETTKQNILNSPIMEIDELILILASRDSKEVTQKFEKLSAILSLLLLIPKYRRAFKESISQCTFKNLQYSEADIYWVHMKRGYNYLGLSLSQRQEQMRKIYKKIPVFYNVEK